MRRMLRVREGCYHILDGVPKEITIESLDNIQSVNAIVLFADFHLLHRWLYSHPQTPSQPELPPQPPHPVSTPIYPTNSPHLGTPPHQSVENLHLMSITISFTLCREVPYHTFVMVWPACTRALLPRLWTVLLDPHFIYLLTVIISSWLLKDSPCLIRH